MKRPRAPSGTFIRLIVSASMMATSVVFTGSSPSYAAVSCKDFGCVKVELTYDGARRMRYFIQAYNFRPGHIVADGHILDSTNQIYIDIPAKTCPGATECVNSDHFNYPNRCDGEVFELIGTGHRREDPETDIVNDSDIEIAPMQSSGASVQESCQR